MVAIQWKSNTLRRDEAVRPVKITDDYKAKFRLWAANPQVLPAPAPPKIPHFRSKRFSSHSEMNAWKEALLRQIAQSAPGQ
jgi:hypothetical protein